MLDGSQLCWVSYNYDKKLYNLNEILLATIRHILFGRSIIFKCIFILINWCIKHDRWASPSKTRNRTRETFKLSDQTLSPLLIYKLKFSRKVARNVFYRFEFVSNRREMNSKRTVVLAIDWSIAWTIHVINCHNIRALLIAKHWRTTGQ